MFTCDVKRLVTAFIIESDDFSVASDLKGGNKQRASGDFFQNFFVMVVEEVEVP